MSDATIKLTPHLHFAGDCEQALDTYKTILGGTYEVVTRYTNPTTPTAAAEPNKIMYAVFHFGDSTFFAGDSFSPHILEKHDGSIGMALQFTDRAQAQRAFDALAHGGQIVVAFDKQFWGGWHGTTIDRFGIRWLINCAE